MKFLVSIFILIFSVASFATALDAAARRSNGLLKFLAEQEGIRDTALASVMNSRCKRYMPDYEARACKEAVKKMIQILDYDVLFTKHKIRVGDEQIQVPYVFIAFKKNLINLLNNEKTEKYLNHLNQEIYRYIMEGKSTLNIWNLTRSFYSSDAETSMVLAALFQDTSIVKLHLAYLELTSHQTSEYFQGNKQLLSRVIDSINLVLDSSEEHYRKLFYPAEIQQNLNRNIYHFYVPLYLASALAQSGTMKLFAYRAPMMLTLSYEFITSSDDYSYLFKDPEKITSESKIKDIFGAHCGSKFGVGSFPFRTQFEKLKSAFGRSSKEGVALLL